MKAIILAAGGVRAIKHSGGIRYLFPRGSKPKCLFHVDGRVILNTLVQALRGAGISDIRIVVGYRAGDIVKFNKRNKLGLEIVYNKDWDSDAVKSILVGIKGIQDDVLILFSDLKRVDANTITQFVKCPHPLAWIKLKKKYQKTMDPEVYVGDRQVYIVKIAKEKLHIFDKVYDHLKRSKKRYGNTYNLNAFPARSGQMIILALLETLYQNGPVADVLIHPPVVDVDLLKQTDEGGRRH